MDVVLFGYRVFVGDQVKINEPGLSHSTNQQSTLLFFGSIYLTFFLSCVLSFALLFIFRKDLT